MNNGKSLPLEVYEFAAEAQRIASIAGETARAESHRKGIPVVHSTNGELCFEWPDGSITTDPPPDLAKRLAAINGAAGAPSDS